MRGFPRCCLYGFTVIPEFSLWRYRQRLQLLTASRATVAPHRNDTADVVDNNKKTEKFKTGAAGGFVLWQWGGAGEIFTFRGWRVNIDGINGGAIIVEDMMTGEEKALGKALGGLLFVPLKSTIAYGARVTFIDNGDTVRRFETLEESIQLSPGCTVMVKGILFDCVVLYGINSTDPDEYKKVYHKYFIVALELWPDFVTVHEAYQRKLAHYSK